MLEHVIRKFKKANFSLGNQISDKKNYSGGFLGRQFIEFLVENLAKVVKFFNRVGYNHKYVVTLIAWNCSINYQKLNLMKNVHKFT